MTEHGQGDRLQAGPEQGQGPGSVTGHDATELSNDLIFAFTGGERLDLYGLSLLLTARQVAFEDDRTVWVAGLSQRSWMLLKALGLEGLFKAFPPAGRLES